MTEKQNDRIESTDLPGRESHEHNLAEEILENEENNNQLCSTNGSHPDSRESVSPQRPPDRSSPLNGLRPRDPPYPDPIPVETLPQQPGVEWI